MAFTSMGLGAVLSFTTGNALAAMNKVAAGFKNLGASASKVKAGLGQIGGSLGGAAIAAAPLTAGLVFAGNQAANFEEQMSGVQAVGKLMPEAMGPLIDEAKRLGAATKFTATEAGAGMELLARAGFSANEVLQSTEGVLHAAAAEGMGMSEAADIIASTMRGMGLSATDAATGLSNATKVADVLALASASTNSSISSLGEGMKYVAPTAKQLGIDVETTTAALGRLADAGLKGSIGGTGLAMSFQRLSAPTKQASELMAKYGILLHQDAQGNIDLAQTFKNVGEGLKKTGSKAERVGLLSTIFGARAAKAAGVLADSAADTTKDGLIPLIEKLKQAKGSAEEMANTRLSNLKGQLTILASASEGLALEIFGPIVKALTPFVTSMHQGIGKVVRAVQILRGAAKKEGEEEITGSFLSIAKGVNDAINWILGAIDTASTMIKSIKNSIVSSFGGDGLASLTKFGALFVFIGGLLAPVLASMAGFGLLMSSVIIPMVSGLISVFMGLAGILFGPVGIALAAVVALIYAFKNENESFLGSAVRLWGVVKDAIMSVWTGAIMPLWQGITEGLAPAFTDIGNIFGSVAHEVKQLWLDIVDIFGSGTQGISIDWIDVGRTIGAVLGALVGAVGEVIKTVIHLFRRWMGIVEDVVQGVREIFSGNVIAGFKKLGGAIFDYFMLPLRNIVALMIKLADSIPGGTALVPKALRDFAEEGIKFRGFDMEADAAARTKPMFDMEADMKNNPPQVNVTNQPPVIKLPDQNLKVQLDGRDIAVSVAKHNQEFHERSGFRATPWQRRMMVEQGAVTVGSGG